MKYSGFPRLSWCSFPLTVLRSCCRQLRGRGETGLASEDGKWRKMIGVGRRLGSSKETGMGNIVFKCENKVVKLSACRVDVGEKLYQFMDGIHENLPNTYHKICSCNDTLTRTFCVVLF